VHVGLQERDEIGTGLADDEVVDVEELGDSLEGRVSVRVRNVRPVVEVGRVGGGPRDNLAVGIFAENADFSAAIEGWRGGVGRYCCGPYQLNGDDNGSCF